MRRRSTACLVLATVLLASLAACKSPEQIQAEHDEADDRRCARLGIPLVPGDPGYVECRMWAAQMRLAEDDERRQNFLLALQAFGALQQQRQARSYQAPFYDEPPAVEWPQPQWITPPPAPQNSWCRLVGRWMSCTGQ